MIDSYKVSKLSVNPGDTIIITLSEFVDVDMAQGIYQQFAKIYPNNSILLKHPDIITNIEVIPNNSFLDEGDDLK